MNNNGISDTNLYEFQTDLSYTTNKISSYGTTDLKEILKGDYLIFQNESLTKIITKSIFYQEFYYVLAIENDTPTFSKTASLLEEGTSFSESLSDFIILNSTIYALDTSYNPVKYDLSGTELPNSYNTHAISNATNAYIRQIKEYIAFIYNQEDQSTIYLYKYDLNINTTTSPLGTIEVPKTSYPNETISYQVTANNGYAVESVTITDEYGNFIATNDNTFIMPNKSVYITINYVEKVSNPETVDIIFFIIITLTLSASIFLLVYRKFQWLK